MKSNYFNPLEEMNVFSSPTKIIFGVGVLENIINELKTLNQEKILIITDKVINETEPVKKFLSVLSSNGFKPKVFISEIKEPTLDMVNQFIDFVRTEKEGIVMGIGGGSIMDQAKVASVLATNEGEFEKYIGVEKVENEGLPLLLVPTTAGTGAETSKNAVIKGKGKKLIISTQKILPNLAIIDPLLTVSLPPRPTGFTGMDALSHAIESIMSTKTNSMVMATSLEAISLINKNLPLAFYSGYNIEARYNMCMAATLAGLSLNGGAVLAHSVSYTLEPFGAPHGLGCAIALPYVIKFNAPVMIDKMQRIAMALDLYDERINDPIETAQYVVDRVSQLNAVVNIPLNLESMSISKEKSRELGEECYEKYPRPNNPRTYSKEDIIKLYEQMWAGDLTIDNM